MMTFPALEANDRDALLSADPAGILTAYLSFPEGSSPQSLPLLLRRELAKVRAELEHESHAARERFDASAELLLEALGALKPHAPAGTWMAAATDRRVLHDEWLPRVLPTMVAWDSTARITPFLAAHRVVTGLVALVDRHHALILSLAHESLSELARWDVDPRPSGTAPDAHGADVAARRSDHVANVNLARTRERLLAEARHDKVVVLGGSHEAVARLANELRPRLGDRLLLADSLSLASAAGDVKAVAHALILAWHAARTAEAVDDALSRATSAHVAVGDDAIEAALARAAVHRLIVSEQRLGERDDRVERLVRRALGQHARFEVAEGVTGERLRELTGGSVALLRFASAPTET